MYPEPSTPLNDVHPTQLEDPELLRRKARAARFNIPLIDATAAVEPDVASRQHPADKRSLHDVGRTPFTHLLILTWRSRMLKS